MINMVVPSAALEGSRIKKFFDFLGIMAILMLLIYIIQHKATSASMFNIIIFPYFIISAIALLDSLIILFSNCKKGI
jgi:hypothetical protein